MKKMMMKNEGLGILLGVFFGFFLLAIPAILIENHLEKTGKVVRKYELGVV